MTFLRPFTSAVDWPIDRRVVAGVVVLVAVAAVAWGTLFVLTLGDCGLGTGGVYTVETVSGMVSSPSQARGVIVQAFETNASTGPYSLATVAENKSVFNRQYVYRGTPDGTFRDTVLTYGAPVDRDEQFFYFSPSPNLKFRGIGVAESGDVFIVKSGAC